eukprot:356892-Chlamydomonas_euryale.AAC.4
MAPRIGRTSDTAVFLAISCRLFQSDVPSRPSLLAPDHQHGQVAGWHPLPDSSDVHNSLGAPVHADPECSDLTGRLLSSCCLMKMERMVGLYGVVGRPRSTWWNRAVAALRSALSTAALLASLSQW